MAFAKTLKEQKLNIFCDFCFRNITTEMYFRCEDCRFDSCRACFLSGIETAVHKNSHRFRTVSNLDARLGDSDWRLIDELLLLDGQISYGFCNFDDICKILPEKTPEEVRKHFFELIEVENNEENECTRSSVPKSNPNDSRIASYMSKRKEFDSEILNEYETLIENLEFNEDDKELDTRLKRRLLDNYGIVLRRRRIWRNFILDRNLVDVSRLRSKEKTDVIEIALKYRWLAQFISKRDFNVFIAGLVKEKRLRNAISKQTGTAVIDLNRLCDISGLLDSSEQKLCGALNLSPQNYIKIKKMALERYIGRLPLKQALSELFHREDSARVTILYKWFLEHGIVHDR